jgi:hypothetical protein
LLALLLSLGPSARAHSKAGDGLEQQAQSCDANVAYFRSKLDTVILWSSVFMIAGALISATGSALAGFLPQNRQRKIAAIAGAIGAVVTILPKALPNKDDLQAKMAAAEKHPVIGAKIRNQTPFAEPGETLTEVQKYASARFTDCASISRPDSVPDFPEGKLAISRPSTRVFEVIQATPEPDPPPNSRPAPKPERVFRPTLDSKSNVERTLSKGILSS